MHCSIWCLAAPSWKRPLVQCIQCRHNTQTYMLLCIANSRQAEPHGYWSRTMVQLLLCCEAMCLTCSMGARARRLVPMVRLQPLRNKRELISVACCCHHGCCCLLAAEARWGCTGNSSGPASGPTAPCSSQQSWERQLCCCVGTETPAVRDRDPSCEGTATCFNQAGVRQQGCTLKAANHCKRYVGGCCNWG